MVFLVDTFDTLKSGVPNAIKVAREFGDKINFQGVRIDSGDMVGLSQTIRQELDNAGFPNAKIYASNDLDEYAITNLKKQNAKIDVWGVGTKLITAFDQPALGAVYKMVSISGNNTIKLSDDDEKISTPGKKQIWRTDTGDMLMLFDEPGVGRPILQDIFVHGKQIYQIPTAQAVQRYAKDSLSAIPAPFKRIDSTEKYSVSLSKRLIEAKNTTIQHVKNMIKEF